MHLQKLLVFLSSASRPCINFGHIREYQEIYWNIWEYKRTYGNIGELHIYIWGHIYIFHVVNLIWYLSFLDHLKFDWFMVAKALQVHFLLQYSQSSIDSSLKNYDGKQEGKSFVDWVFFPKKYKILLYENLIFLWLGLFPKWLWRRLVSVDCITGD